jgi:hypothetical protein
VVHIQALSALECENEIREAERRLKLFEDAFECKVKLDVSRKDAKEDAKAQSSL